MTTAFGAGAPWPDAAAYDRSSAGRCVAKWTKFDTKCEGVSLDTILAAGGAAGVAGAAYVIAFCDGGYTTNLPLADVTGDKAWVVFGYDGAPLAPEHGGPARLLVPHLYFWKSAKWVRGLALCDGNHPGFWESLGYHNRGDPWKEQRYTGDWWTRPRRFPWRRRVPSRPRCSRPRCRCPRPAR